MSPDLLNYQVSVLNPALKLAVPFVFLWAAYYAFRVRNQYEGELGEVVGRLTIAAMAGVFASAFRFGADYWFESLKWGESLFLLAFGIANVYAAWPLVAFMKRMGSQAAGDTTQ